MICETCLGPNPYVRMTKLPFGTKLCKISNLPFQGFRWKPGPNGRHKETIISYAVAVEKNICQTCLNDIRFNLPVGVRDKILKKSLHSTSSNQLIAQPKSVIGNQVRYLHAQENPDVPNDSQLQLAEMQQLQQVRQLEMLSKSIHNPWSSHDQDEPSKRIKEVTAFRNLPKLCTFWLNGACTRVSKKSCPFRPCCGTYVFPEVAKTSPETHKQLKQLLESEGPDKLQKSLPKEIRQALQAALKTGNRDEAIKKRVYGEDELSKSYLQKYQDLVNFPFPNSPF
jgi:pre-mRNA-splicing factor RBM22/SLT11